MGLSGAIRFPAVFQGKGVANLNNCCFGNFSNNYTFFVKEGIANVM